MRYILATSFALSLFCSSELAASIADVKPATTDIKVYASRSGIGFTNASDEVVKFHWRLVAGDHRCPSGDGGQEIGPKGTIYVVCVLSPEPHWLRAGLLKPEKRSGVLRIATDPKGLDDVEACGNCIDHLVTLTLGYYGESNQSVVNALALLLLLIAGGLFSHWIGTALPNLRRRKLMKARLERLRWDISWRAADIDNELPSRLATDRSRMADQIAGLPAWGNDTADTLTEIRRDLDLLDQRVALFGRIVTVRERLTRAAATDFRRRMVDRAIATLLLKLAAADQSEGFTGLADELVTLISAPEDTDAAFEVWCQDREGRLRSIVTRVAGDPLFRQMADACAAVGSTDLRPTDYVSRELTVHKLALIERFNALAPPPIRTDKESWIAELIAARDMPPLKGLRMRLIKWESGTTIAAAAAGLTDDAIVLRPSSPRVFEPAILEFVPHAELASVLRRFDSEAMPVVRWVFSFEKKEKFRAVGTLVRCYFSEVGTYVIHLRLDDVVVVTKNVTVERSRARVTAQFRIQAARLVGTQFLAAGVAFATAWDKLLGTELVVAVIAALAAGYGADTVKSVGAAIVSKVTGSGASSAVRQQEFANANAALEE